MNIPNAIQLFTALDVIREWEDIHSLSDIWSRYDYEYKHGNVGDAAHWLEGWNYSPEEYGDLNELLAEADMQQFIASSIILELAQSTNLTQTELLEFLELPKHV